MKNNNNSGFTLIELLVATIILFTAMGAVSLIYRGAFISSEKASNHVNIVANVPALLSQIKQDVQNANPQQTQLNGQGSAWQSTYTWQATVQQTKTVTDDVSKLEFGEQMALKKQFKLWQVVLTINSNGIVKNYTFNEVSWHDA
ncbi:prepilin-type N-terminal cleavage/methylation domain-containing protein [Pseudoalteromonas sp. SG45-5]|uniref:PulJ/GspJ family protein n=1 Tax=unclassified Pseudoalteromonas TaxID=194690 RepID=UPI0015FB1521|nr:MULTISPECIES: prepilin-type N-terminal cleavage/methylation domain-containing protein [unclassified Pseudoalteromonas]MBB1386214.1 prepilin-type N-terminal cleavage/methylation domain-containing protein [Pseudoalteromonas sp. SG45-5]MBB1394129.1 prepilin-type N-terminal cleavage/methylation domain-containing protein [Pseudoalteromonas sp. SG44-4]MBB1448983.1 prepilin-type N-terminal cleavage/methylation domain-containing protein [Pseudoalteromonas sp. SG41-6]